MPNFFWGFMTGAVAGAYIAQTYDIPKVTELFELAKEKVSNIEKDFPKKKEDD